MPQQATQIGWNSPDFEGTKEERCKEMVKTALRLDDQPEHTFAVDHDLELLRMFEQRPMTIMYANAGKYFSQANSLSLATVNSGSISPMNVLRSVVSTGHAVMARSKIRGRFLTTNGTGKQKKRAAAATQWLDGWSSEERAHEIAGQALLDAMVCRFGVVQVYEEDHKVKLQRILPQEIVFDHTAGLYGLPKTIYRKRAISKGTLLAKFGKKDELKREAIKGANTLETTDGTVSDLVPTWEAWALPSSPKAKDGWHAIGIDGADGALFIEVWEKPWYPLIFFMWDIAMIGFSGVSLAAQLENMQTDLNYMLWVERKAMKKFAVPRLGIKRGSKILKSQLTNDIAGIVEYTDEPPVPLIWPYLPEQFFREKDKLIEKMYSLSGVSQNVSEGTKPEGTESGVSQREAQETQNLRLQIYAQRSWENPIVEIFEKAVEMAADIVADGHEYEVTAATPGEINQVDFAKTVADLKQRKITCYPSGFLPLTPAARLDFIRSMMDAKLWDVDRAKMALADLDVESEQTLENSIARMFVKIFENALYEGKPSRPNELAVGYYDLAVKTGMVYLGLAELEDISPKNRDLAQRYLDELKVMKQAAQGPQGQPQAAPAAPGGAPAPEAAQPPPAVPAAA